MTLQGGTIMMIATTKPTTSKLKTPVLSDVRLGTSKLAKPIMVAGLEHSSGHSGAIVAREAEMSGLRSWERVSGRPIVARPVAVSRVPAGVNSQSVHNNIVSNNWMGQSRAVAAPASIGWMGTSNNRRVPVKIMTPSLSHISR